MLKLGRLRFSDSLAIWSISSWDGLPGMYLEMKLPNKGPAMTAVGKPTIKP
ncbi:hypothetical protein D3C86_2139430 [compost metagenome]